MKNTTGREVVYKMMASGCPGIPVVNEESEVVGDNCHDIVHRFYCQDIVHN